MARYIKKKVTSREGLSQERALTSLQDHPQFVPGSRISSLNKEEERWVATILIPKQAAPPPFPPKDDEGGEEEVEIPDKEEKPKPPSDGPDDGPDGPPDADGPDDGDKPDGKLDDSQKLDELLTLVHKLLSGGEADLGPEGPPPPPLGPGGPGPHAGPKPPGGPGGPPGGAPGRPLRPGMAPPGATPVGAPAFASIKGKVASFTAETSEQKSVKQAKEELEREFDPYKVKQIKRQGGKLRALLSVR